MRKFLFLIGLFFVLFALLVIPAQAVENDDDGIIEAGQVIDDDLFIEAEKVLIDGRITGNLFINGSDVIVNGQVDGNLFIFGAVSQVNGPVGGSLAFMGKSLELNNHVAGSVFAMGASVVLEKQAEINHNIYFSGYNFEASPGSLVGVDASIMGYQAILKGNVGRDLFGEVSALELEGTIGRNIDIEVDAPSNDVSVFKMGPFPNSIPSGIRVSDQASVAGKLNYTSTSEQSATIAISPSQVIYHPLQNKKEPILWKSLLERVLRNFVTLLLLGGLVLWLLPHPFEQTTQKVRQILPSLGWGIVTFIVFPLVILLAGGVIIVCGTLLGIVTLSRLAMLVLWGGFLALALIVIISLILLLYLSKLVVANAVGNWLFRRVLPTYKGHAILPLALGILLYVLLATLPLIGFMFSVLVALIGLGAIWLTYYQRKQDSTLPPIETSV